MINSRGMLVIASVLLFCVTLTVVGPSWAADEVDRIRQKCEEFFISLTKNEYKLYAEGKKPKYESSHKDFNYLFKEKKIGLIREKAAAATDPKEARALNLLADALSYSAVRFYAAPDIDQMYDFMMTATISYNGESVSFADVRKAIAMEEDRDTRRQMYIAFNTHLEPLKFFKSGILSKMDERLTQWGFESYLDMISTVRELDEASLEADAESFLSATDSLYTAELTRLLCDRLQVDLRRARGYDIPYILRGSWLDGDLVSNNAKSLVEDFFESMDLKARKAKLKIESEEFCGESIAPRVFPLIVPEDIKMCFVPIGGTCDLASHLYMRGKAECIASIRQKEYFELRRLGNKGMWEAAGLLFERLACDPAWLTGVAGLDPEIAEAVARHRAFVLLYETRRNCVSTLFQIGTYSGAGAPEQLYGDLLQKYMKWDPVLDKNRAALEISELDSAVLMQGYFLSAQLSRVLEEKFGENWFSSVEAGAFLKDLWREGQMLNAESAAAKLGYEGVSPSLLVADVGEALGAR